MVVYYIIFRRPKVEQKTLGGKFLQTSIFRGNVAACPRTAADRFRLGPCAQGHGKRYRQHHHFPGHSHFTFHSFLFTVFPYFRGTNANAVWPAEHTT